MKKDYPSDNKRQCSSELQEIVRLTARSDPFLHECLENCQNEETTLTYLSKTAHEKLIKLRENLSKMKWEIKTRHQVSLSCFRFCCSELLWIRHEVCNSKIKKKTKTLGHAGNQFLTFLPKFIWNLGTHKNHSNAVLAIPQSEWSFGQP